MDKLLFVDYTDFACAVSNAYDYVKENEDLNDVSIIAKYEEMKEIIRELICVGYDIRTILFDDPEIDGYEDEYICTIYDSELWVEPFKRGNKYITDESCVTYVLDNCNSKVIQNIEANLIYEIEIGCDCEDCDGCDYCGTVGCKETPVETVKNDVSCESTYRVNGKEVDKATYEAKEKEFLKEYCDMMDDFNNKLSTLNEVDRLIHRAFRFGF